MLIYIITEINMDIIQKLNDLTNLRETVLSKNLPKIDGVVFISQHQTDLK